LTDSFNLLEERWIPCLELGTGNPVERSLLDTIREAHVIQEIRHPSPIVNLALHRFVVAFLYSVFRGPDRLTGVEEMLRRERFDQPRIADYAASWYQKLWLFGERAFLQDVSLAAELASDNEQLLPIEQLRRETAAPFGKTLFDHTLYESGSMTAAEAARNLLADQFFGLQDGRGYSQSPLSTGLATMAVGRNLFETLTLNLLPYNAQTPIKATDPENDSPIWERDSPVPCPIPDGWLDYLTRPYRRLLLVRDGGGNVTHVYRRAGPHLDKDWRANVLDPWLSYQIRDSGPRPLALQAERALWRDSQALIQQFIDRDRGNPGYVRLLSRLRRESIIDVFGVSSDNNAVRTWRHERLPVATDYLGDERLRHLLEVGIGAAEKVASEAVLGSMRDLARYSLIPNWDQLSKEDQTRQWRQLNKRPSAGKRSRLEDFIESLAPLRAYWPALDVPFRTYMVRLATEYESDYGEPANAWWAEQVSRAARDAFAQACRALETESRGYRAAAEAGPLFRYLLNKALEPLQGEESTSEPEEVTA